MHCILKPIEYPNSVQKKPKSQKNRDKVESNLPLMNEFSINDSISSHFSTTTTSRSTSTIESDKDKDFDKNHLLIPELLISENFVKSVSDNYICPLHVEDNEIILEIECGQNVGLLYLSKLCQGSRGLCIRYQNVWLTPNEFQLISGRESAKDWKRSIRHCGKSLKLLLNKGILICHTPLCQCSTITAATTEQPREISPEVLTAVRMSNTDLLRNNPSAMMLMQMQQQRSFSGSPPEQVLEKRESRLTSIIDQLLISRTSNSNGSFGLNGVVSTCSTPSPEHNHTANSTYTNTRIYYDGSNPPQAAADASEGGKEEKDSKDVKEQLNNNDEKDSNTIINSNTNTIIKIPTKPVSKVSKRKREHLKDHHHNQNHNQNHIMGLGDKDLLLVQQQQQRHLSALQDIKNERLSPEDLQQRSASTSPPIKQMEHMMSRNYSDLMRNLAAKYNNSNPNEFTRPLLDFDTRFLKPGAAAAAASLLLSFEKNLDKESNQIQFPMIDMSSTNTLLSMVRTAAQTNPLLSSDPFLNNNNNNSNMSNSKIAAAIKRANSPLDLSSGGGGSSAAGSPTPPPGKKAKRQCISTCLSGCSSESQAVLSWSVDEVCRFVQSIDLCREYVQAFHDSMIDGSSLPLLTEEHLMSTMSMKLGPALKFKTMVAKKLGNCVICSHCTHCHENNNNGSGGTNNNNDHQKS